MKHVAALVPLVALGVRGAGAVGVSPITRVVELLRGLSTKIEEEAKTEESLYENFVCWGKTIVSEKTASNQKAASRKESLETYIQDLDAGKIELTTERQDLTKEIADLAAGIEQATALREQEHEDYLAAQAELEQGITALEAAISTLDGAQDTSASQSLIRLRSRAATATATGSVRTGYARRAAEARSLKMAVEIGRRSLSGGDALFLQRLLEGDAPIEKDWKKLNRKATFKSKYESRTGSIKQTLNKLLTEFTQKLEDVEAQEKKAQEVHDTLMGAKGDQKAKAEKALEAMELEGAARGLSKSEAQAEIDALTQQIADDERFIQQTEDALAKKEEEWAARKKIRTGELEAIGKAISVLYSDDARDLFKRSGKSQGYLFVQERQTVLRRVSAHGQISVASRAAAVLRATGSGAIAELVGSAVPAHFARVIEAIDSMIATLEEQEHVDLENKEHCEKARAEDTREAILVSREIDELSETVVRLKSKIEELKAQIEEKEQEIKETEATLKEAERNRQDEHAEWQKADQDDHDAAALVKEAAAVLEEFYKGIALAQAPPQVVAGEAPPPPPSTWEGGYAGKQEEQTGIVSILTLIHQDILDDQAAAKQAEDDAEAKYQAFLTESEAQLTTLRNEITDMDGAIGEHATAITDAQADISGKQGELEAVMKRIKDAQPGCDFYTVNFVTRTKARQVEKDGLVEARAILSGAKFD